MGHMGSLLEVFEVKVNENGQEKSVEIRASNQTRANEIAREMGLTIIGESNLVVINRGKKFIGISIIALLLVGCVFALIMHRNENKVAANTVDMGGAETVVAPKIAKVKEVADSDYVKKIRDNCEAKPMGLIDDIFSENTTDYSTAFVVQGPEEKNGDFTYAIVVRNTDKNVYCSFNVKAEKSEKFNVKEAYYNGVKTKGFSTDTSEEYLESGNKRYTQNFVVYAGKIFDDFSEKLKDGKIEDKEVKLVGENINQKLYISGRYLLGVQLKCLEIISANHRVK